MPRMSKIGGKISIKMYIIGVVSLLLVGVGVTLYFVLNPGNKNEDINTNLSGDSQPNEDINTNLSRNSQPIEVALKESQLEFVEQENSSVEVEVEKENPLVEKENTLGKIEKENPLVEVDKSENENTFKYDDTVVIVDNYKEIIRKLQIPEPKQQYSTVVPPNASPGWGAPKLQQFFETDGFEGSVRKVLNDFVIVFLGHRQISDKYYPVYYKIDKRLLKKSN